MKGIKKLENKYGEDAQKRGLKTLYSIFIRIDNRSEQDDMLPEGNVAYDPFAPKHPDTDFSTSSMDCDSDNTDD